MEKTELIAKAAARYIRVSPRKARLVIDLIRGEKVNPALAILANTNKGSKTYVEKLLRSAISNAKLNPQVKTSDLFISKITVDNGPMLKRFRAASMGRATMIKHRTSHITIELSRLKQKELKIKEKKTPKRQRIKK